MLLWSSYTFLLFTFAPHPWTLICVFYSLQFAMKSFRLGPRSYWLHFQLLAFLPISHPTFAVLSIWWSQLRDGVAHHGEARPPLRQRETAPGAPSEAIPPGCAEKPNCHCPLLLLWQIVPRSGCDVLIRLWFGSCRVVLIGVGSALATYFINWPSRLYCCFASFTFNSALSPGFVARSLPVLDFS